MGAVVQYRQGGPATWEVVEAVTGGQFVEGRAASKIGVAAAASVRVLGVALTDAAPKGPDYVVPTQPGGAGTQWNLSSGRLLPAHTAVAYAGTEVTVKFTANANFGDALVITGPGTVGPAGATPDARTIVARCTEPGGVVFATKPYGLVRIGN